MKVAQLTSRLEHYENKLESDLTTHEIITSQYAQCTLELLELSNSDLYRSRMFESYVIECTRVNQYYSRPKQSLTIQDSFLYTLFDLANVFPSPMIIRYEVT